MKHYFQIILFVFISINICGQNNSNPTYESKIDRKALVGRHKIITNTTNSKSPAQVGNGEFAFGTDITGLQTFVSFNTLSQWSWHSFPLPEGTSIEDFKGTELDTHGRSVQYDIPNSEQPELSRWLSGNPHRFNLGRIGFQLLKSDGTLAKETDLKNARQETDLWTGIITSYFELEGLAVNVKTAVHPTLDALGVSVNSELIKKGQLKIYFDFPYPDSRTMNQYLGEYNLPGSHTSVLELKGENAAMINRKMDETEYFVSLNWTSSAKLLSGDTILSPHRFYLNPVKTDELEFTCTFSPDKKTETLCKAGELIMESKKAWPEFWNSGAAIDLSESTDPRWKELERRIVLSQYLMKVNEAGSLPPQEAGLVNNGWYGRFHFEMIWWHGVHYALWNRWSLLEKSLQVYDDFLPTSMERATKQGYKGARWPKCTADFDREWPHPIHAMLIWQQPHPIYFAELDYRLHPTIETLEKWKGIVFETAYFMADYAYFVEENDRYILGPPMYIVSENTKPETTFNPAFELAYWHYGLKKAQTWRTRLGLAKNADWENVLDKLSTLPQQEGVYVTHENIENMWTEFNFEHPGLVGICGILPGDGVDTAAFSRTLEKIDTTWNFSRTWGWDFPMLAMAAARSGNQEMAIDMLLHSSAAFQFDEHGLATGGPFPYFPSNGALLTAVAMMAAGWDGSTEKSPGFPQNGEWVIRSENFNKME